MPGLTGRGLLVMVVLAASGCAIPQPVVPPTRPPVPGGWVVIAGGGVRVAVPAEWGPDVGGDPHSVMASAMLAENASVTLIAAGPRNPRQPRQPVDDARLEAWILAWISPTAPASRTRSRVLLPAGPAVFIHATYLHDAPDFTVVEGYAVPTPVGVAFLGIMVDRKLLGRWGAAMGLIPSLFQVDSGDAS